MYSAILKSGFLLFVNLVLIPFAVRTALAQQTNNSSSLTNQAAPSASSVTTGGTNINYQTNNAYQNEFGFGPGLFCRTPTVFVGGNYGENELDAFDPVTKSGNNSDNFSVNVGIVVPFGSSVIEACRRIAKITAEDREISTQLSMIRACAQLQREGIKVNPELFPLLEKCSVSVLGTTTSPPVKSGNLNDTNRLTPKPPIKVPQTTRS